ncbi:ABC branched-chain amino acid transporter substrate-binding protein [Sinomonas atrocyanea]|uniref:ABC branched-chain amino acid transporter substrate-binding protein n=1 Tax=Sinomonas atrocyanea TaxID=37927 RepID=A0A127A2Y6_9MICC|nr:ABC branched-chain amino acid transporter substrate-binding protein [Sinomonas atrocyanea]GEB63643.1 ABC transporter substrate-binding protein [Sinomonas atrocyanea]GGG58081.1 ABC transporter substrate-binding protein [Sinomonas atrocyanea]
MKGTRVKATTKFLLTASLATGLAATGCAPSTSSAASGSDSARTVNVGIVYSKTGPLAAYGAAYYQGLQAGIKYATGGTGKVGNATLNLTYQDDAGDPDKAVAEAKDLIGKDYKILAGTVASGVALKLAQQAEQNKVLYISGPAATDALQGVNKYTFRSGRQSLQDVATAGTFVDNLQGKKIVVFAQNNAFGQGNVAAVKAVLGAKGATVQQVLVPEDATEFTPFARQIIDAKPAMTFVAWAGATSGAMWQSLSQQGVFDAAPVVTGLGDASTFSAYGAASGKISFLSHYFPGAGGNNAVEQEMVKDVEAAGAKPDLFTPDGFVAGQMIVQAVKAGANVDDMVKGLEGYSFDGPKGKESVRASDHVLVQPMYQAKLVQKDGAWTPQLVKTVPAEAVAPAEKKG